MTTLCLRVVLTLSLLLFSCAALSAQNTKTITVTWEHPATTGVVFDLFRISGASCSGTATKVGSALAVKTFVDTPPTDGIWCYYVVAIRGAEASAPSSFALANIKFEAPKNPTAKQAE